MKEKCRRPTFTLYKSRRLKCPCIEQPQRKLVGDLERIRNQTRVLVGLLELLKVLVLEDVQL